MQYLILEGEVVYNGICLDDEIGIYCASSFGMEKHLRTRKKMVHGKHYMISKQSSFVRLPLNLTT